MGIIRNLSDATQVAMFGYNAIVDKKRRRAPVATTKSEDRVLRNHDRRKANATARETRRNSALCAWMIRKHLDYITHLTFQAQTDNEKFNARFEELMRWWARRGNCDVAGRHSLRRFIRTAETMRVLDGDIGIMLLRSGQIQAIEADRIANPQGKNIPNLSQSDLERAQNGVITDGNGRAIRYIINKRQRNSDSLVYDKTVRAQNLKLLGYFDRFDQLRGISPLMTVMDNCADINEVQEYQRVKQKISSLFGVAIKRDMVDDDDGFAYADDGSGNGRYDFELKTGLKLEMSPGDDIDMIESKTPGQGFIDFQNMSIQLALLALDIPYCVYDSRQSSYSAQRQGLLDYQRAAKVKIDDLREVLDEITAWKLSTWANQGLIEIPNGLIETLPGGRTINRVQWQWRHCGVPWIDPLKEVTAYATAIQNGLLSRRESKNLMGCTEQPWQTTVRELAEEEALITETGVTVQLAQPGAVTSRDEEGTDNPANETAQDIGNQDG